MLVVQIYSMMGFFSHYFKNNLAARFPADLLIIVPHLLPITTSRLKQRRLAEDEWDMLVEGN